MALRGRGVELHTHVVARWTRKVKIPGTKHPTRGKAMKADKLFYVFELTKKRMLSFKPRPGTATLANTALRMIKELISEVKPVSVRMILDAGGCKGSVIARLNMRTKIRGCKELVRTISLLNEKEKGKGKDRFYPLYTNDEVTSAYDLLVEYRSRQNHELCYRSVAFLLNVAGYALIYDLMCDMRPKLILRKASIHFCSPNGVFKCNDTERQHHY